jgi:hypothetical protein
MNLKNPSYIAGSKNGIIAISETKSNNIILFKISPKSFQPNYLQKFTVTYPTKISFDKNETLYVLSKNNTLLIFDKDYERQVIIENRIKEALPQSKITDFKVSETMTLFILTNDELYIFSKNGILESKLRFNKIYQKLGINFYDDIFLLHNDTMDQLTKKGFLLNSTQIETNNEIIKDFFLYSTLGIVIFTAQNRTWTMAETPQIIDLSITNISKSNTKDAKILSFTLTSPSNISIHSKEQKKKILTNDFLKSGQHQFLIETGIDTPITVEAISVFDKTYSDIKTTSK